MRVMQSDHELFTAAVRSVLPRFRFEPARSRRPSRSRCRRWCSSALSSPQQN
jgi:hypothetical protein